MFNMTRNMEYALMTLKALADLGHQELTTARKISTKLKVPYDNVAKALQKFAKMGLVESEQGVKGGYKLVADLEKTSIFSVLEGIEGPLGLVRCQSQPKCDHVKTCNIVNPADRLNSLLIEVLESQSIAQFFGQSGPSPTKDFAVWR